MNAVTSGLLGNAAYVLIELAASEGSTKTDGLFPFPDIGGTQVGIWEVEPAEWSVSTNEEIFVILSGNGNLTLPKTGEKVDLVPGAIVKLNKDESSAWVVTEELRKVYMIDPYA